MDHLSETGHQPSQLKQGIRYLVWYYGVWQFFHLANNVWAFFFDMSAARALLGGRMNDEQFQALAGSGVIDLAFVSPTAILFVVAYLRRKSWAVPIGLISLSSAMYSAYLYVYLHLVYDTYVFDLGQFLLIWGTFLPNIGLFILLTWQSMRGGRYEQHPQGMI